MNLEQKIATLARLVPHTPKSMNIQQAMETLDSLKVAASADCPAPYVMSQADLDQQVQRIQDYAREAGRRNQGKRTEHFDRKRWRIFFPTLSEQGLDMMMEWRRTHRDAKAWPQAVIEPQLVNGKPTGKDNVVKILEGETP